MREQIEILASLQNVDREIKEKADTKAALLADIRKKEADISAKKAEMALVRAEWLEKDKIRREKEQTLQEEGRKATDKRMRMSRIKNIKEMQALQREIEQARQSNLQLEEDLLKVMEDLERAAAVLKENEESLKSLEQEWREKKSAIDSELAALDEGIAGASALRQSIASRLNGDLVQRYELIFSRRGGMAVVQVSGGICQGCHMNIPPQLWNEIIKSDRLNLCPSCHRILYYKPAVPSDKQL